MYRSRSPSPGVKQYAWESDQSRSPDRKGRRRGRSPSFSPPARRRSRSRQNRRNDRRRSRSRSRSRGKGKGKGKGKLGTCFDLILGKRCKMGDRCPYSHPDEEDCKRVREVLSRQPCKQGANCSRPDCIYAHPDDDRRRRRRRSRSCDSSGSRSSSQPRIPMMKAVGLRSYGEVTVLEELRLPKPELHPASKHLLIRLLGSDMNSVDVKMREGALTKELSPAGYRVMGYASAGVIEEMSEEAAQSGKFKVGDAVWFANSWEPSNGSNQEYCLIDHRVASLKPKVLAFAEAAAIPLVALTAWGAMFEHMNMDLHLLDSAVRPLRFTPEKKGVFLALPGGGGAGSLALQLAARYLNKNRNLIVIASASRPDSVEWCKKMGAEHVINHEAWSLKDELDKIGIKGVDYVFHGKWPMTFTAQHEENLYAIMNPLGQIASYHEGNFEKLDSCRHKRISLHQECTDARAMFNYFPEVDGEILKRVAQLFDDPSVSLQSVLTKKLELTAETVRSAHSRMFLDASVGDPIGKAAFEIKGNCLQN